MATNNKPTIFLSLSLLLLSLLLVHLAESRVVLPESKGGKKSGALVCAQTYGAESGDTCFTVATAFNLTTQFFAAINPNLDCKKIFIGEWLCVDGFTL